VSFMDVSPPPIAHALAPRAARSGRILRADAHPEDRLKVTHCAAMARIPTSIEDAAGARLIIAPLEPTRSVRL